MFKRSLFAAVLALATPALADPPIIQNVVVSRSGDLWRFDVTIRHDDSGWDHYADAWRIVGPEGQPLGMRNLAHPHVREQPFTRSLSGVRIPEGITEVGIQARDNVDGWAEQIKTVRLP
jgi:hypothetical protein